MHGMSAGVHRLFQISFSLFGRGRKYFQPDTNICTGPGQWIQLATIPRGQWTKLSVLSPSQSLRTARITPCLKTRPNHLLALLHGGPGANLECVMLNSLHAQEIALRSEARRTNLGTDSRSDWPEQLGPQSRSHTVHSAGAQIAGIAKTIFSLSCGGAVSSHLPASAPPSSIPPFSVLQSAHLNLNPPRWVNWVC